MAYLVISVAGNPDFGGYLSVDGESSILLTDDITYELTSGAHYFEIFTKSDAQRKLGQGQQVFNNIMGTGGFIGAISEAQAENSLGESWNFQVRAGDDEAVFIDIVSKGNTILSAPRYRVTQLDDETLEHLQSIFRAQEEEQRKAEEEKRAREEAERIARATTPRRSIPKIIVGAILSFYSFCAVIAVGIGIASNGWPPAVLLLPMIPLVIFLIMLFDGIRRKIR